MTRSPSAADALRPFIYGDQPINAWPVDDTSTARPWDLFIRARRALGAGEPDTAIRLWWEVAEDLDLESRQSLQAWHFLRAHGVEPSENITRRVLGAVVEIPTGSGHDLLAAYADGSVRYLNSSGKAVVVEPNAAGSSVDAAARTFVDSMALVAAVAGPWDQPGLPALGPTDARVLALTPGGIRFGQAPFETLNAQPPSAAVIAAAIPLLAEIVEKAT